VPDKDQEGNLPLNPSIGLNRDEESTSALTQLFLLSLYLFGGLKVCTFCSREAIEVLAVTRDLIATPIATLLRTKH
jgi:hypothetical protein